MHPRVRSVLVVAAAALVVAAPAAGLGPDAAASGTQAGDATAAPSSDDDAAVRDGVPMRVGAQEDDDGQESDGDGGRNATSDEPGPDVGSANVTVLQTPEVVGQPLVVEATTTNEGTEAGRKVVQFEVEHEILDRAVFVLQSNETKTVTFRHVFETPGNKTFEVDSGVNRFVTVEERRPELSVSSVRVEPASVEAGGDVTVTALVRNTGYANGSLPVALELFGEVAGVKNVTLATGESAEVTFTRSVYAPGSYEATVANTSAVFQVTGTESTSASTTDSMLESASETPGFGPAVALAAVLAAALLIVGRRA